MMQIALALPQREAVSPKEDLSIARIAPSARVGLD
jgi:hypothetical protein